MVIVQMSFEDMAKELSPVRMEYYDCIVPIDSPECPAESEWKPPRLLKRPKDRYASSFPPNSDLWFHFVDRVYNRRLEEIVRAVAGWGLIEELQPIVGLALENAFYHGNQNNPTLPVSVKAFTSKFGGIIRIRDSGKGFDVGETIRKVHKLYPVIPSHPPIVENIPVKDRYFSRFGTGFYRYHNNKDFNVSFEGTGSIVNIFYRNAMMRR